MTIVERRKEEKEALRMCGGFVTYILSVPYLSYIRLRLRWGKAACTIAHVVQNGKDPAEAELKTTPIVCTTRLLPSIGRRITYVKPMLCIIRIGKPDLKRCNAAMMTTGIQHNSEGFLAFWCFVES
jgi:hypothetical protein